MQNDEGEESTAEGINREVFWRVILSAAVMKAHEPGAKIHVENVPIDVVAPSSTEAAQRVADAIAIHIQPACLHCGHTKFKLSTQMLDTARLRVEVTSQCEGCGKSYSRIMGDRG